MKIRDFVKQFYKREELERWLVKQSKDYLYTMYMEEREYKGKGYREITREELKLIFTDVYLRLALKGEIPSACDEIDNKYKEKLKEIFLDEKYEY